MKISPPLNVVRTVYVTQERPAAMAIAPSVRARPEVMADRRLNHPRGEWRGPPRPSTPAKHHRSRTGATRESVRGGTPVDRTAAPWDHERGPPAAGMSSRAVPRGSPGSAPGTLAQDPFATGQPLHLPPSRRAATGPRRGWRRPSIASRRNSVNSSTNSTPWCASVQECS
jgi:hypothetical protein